MLKIYAFFQQSFYSGRKTRLFLSAILAALVTLAWPNAAFAAPATQDGQYVYDIMRNGTQIGTYSFDVSTQEKSTTIRANMNIEAKVLFLTAYKADHRRTEVRVNGALQSMEGDALFNGKSYTFSYDAAQNLLVQNDKEQVLAHPAVTLTPFLPNALEGKFVGISEKGIPHEAGFIDHGMVKKKSGIKLKPFREIIFTGDVRRDLWYTPEGVLESLSYDKDGATITFKLRQPN